MFIQTETTPNPATLKFLPGRAVLPQGTLDLRNEEDAARSPLAAKLFEIPQVSGVFFGQDFITVTKSEGEWLHLKPAILGAIMEHYLSGQPILKSGASTQTSADDGGDITFRGYKDGVVFLNMKGACAGCPSSTATLKNGIENLLRHFVPDVQEVRPM
jgi:hypothetical protein